MKKIISHVMYLYTLIIIFSCKENNDLFTYDESKTSIYFDYQYESENGRINNSKGIDSIDFSFTNVGLNQDKYVIKVPVKISGNSKDFDRTYSYKIVDSLTSLNDEYYSIRRHTIAKNIFVDTLEIEVSKYIDLQSSIKKLTIVLLPNEYFDSGYMNNQIIKIKVSNMLTRPTWWNTWEGVLGTYSQEKYQMWMQIYAVNVDPTENYLFSYKNMPTIANKSYYPRTFAFIAQLKEYFEKNIVYEGGDPTKPRVTIPYVF